MKLLPATASVSKTVADLAAAMVVSGGLAWSNILPVGDVFRSSLIALPWVCFALVTLERAGVRMGANRLRLRESRIEALLLGLLLVLTLQRQSLGLPGIDGYLAAGFGLMLVSRTARLLVALRPCLGQVLPRRPPLVFFFLPWVVYLALQPWMNEHRPPDGDEPYNLLLTHSVAYDLDLDLENNYRQEDWHFFMPRPIEPQVGDPRGANGEVFSRHNALLPLLSSLPYRVAGLYGVMAFLAALTALVAWMVLRLAASCCPRRPGSALLAYGIFAFSPPVLVYSYQVWVEVPAALALALAFDRLLLGRRGGWRPVDVVCFCLAVAALPLLKLRFALVSLPLVILAVASSRLSRRFLAVIAAMTTLVLIAVLAVNQVRYGNPLKIHQWSELTFRGKSIDAFLHGAVGVFFDSAFGLFGSAPIWWLLLPAVFLAVRRRNPLLVDLLSLGLVYNLALWPRLEWYGGWAPPFRYPFLFLPLMVLLLIPLLDRRKEAGIQVAWVVLGAVTLGFTLLWVVVPGWTYNFADGRSDWLDAAGRILGADVVRFFPSTVRPRAATWVWLLLSLALAPALLLWRRKLRAASSLGVGLLLVAIGGLPIAARSLPTRVVEIEDVQVRHSRTIAFPETWMMQRSSARAGRQVKYGGLLELPVVPGGGLVEVRIVAKAVGPASELKLLLQAGERDLGRVMVEHRDWYEVTLGPVSWSGEDWLIIAGPAGSPEEKGGVMIDRVELTWWGEEGP